jgi:putative transposase
VQYKSYKIRLELNNKQTSNALQHCGVKRHAWNWALDICKETEKIGGKLPSAIDLHKRLVAEVKKENEWYYNLSKSSPQQALRNLQESYTRFFRQLKNGEIEKKRAKYVAECKKNGTALNFERLYDIGKPKFKKKGINDGFYLEGSIKTNGNKIKVPRFGWLKCSEQIPNTLIKNCTISRTANQWFISFKTEYKPVRTVKKFESVGVDLGIKTLATLSNLEIFSGVRPYKSAKKKLVKQQRESNRRFIKGAKNQSNNYKKSAKKLAKTHARVANARKDSLHKLTSYLAKNFKTVIIEDLKPNNMAKNHKLASAILDVGFYEFKRQLLYKKEWYGGNVIIANQFFASSKICSRCGCKKDVLKLSERLYKCDSCNFVIDRDLNASYNLNKLAVSSTVSAFGENVATSKEVQFLDELGIKHRMFSFV